MGRGLNSLSMILNATGMALAREALAVVSVAFSVDGVTPRLAMGAGVVAMKAKAAQRLVM